MRFFEKTARALATTAFAVCSALWIMILSVSKGISPTYLVTQGQSLELSEFVKPSLCAESIASSTTESECAKYELRLFGIFPIKTVDVMYAERKYVLPGGIPFGVKMISDGVMITAVSGINCGGNILSPARDAGIKIGDVIVSVNGKQVRSNDDVVSAISTGSKDVTLKIRHQNGNTEQISLEAALDPSDNCYKLGIWVRDSSAGIGTVTFFDPQNGTFGGLGHPVCDSDTGNTLALLEGEIVAAEIDGVVKGKSGTPGRLCGHFMPYSGAGEILKNDDTGVYGTLSCVKAESEAIPVAFKQEVKTGKATILTTISGTQAEEYEIEIEKICVGSRNTKNMVVHVTDKRLLEKTGGIVQGMSGSPIIQDGRLVGAVSHVFVNDCTRGYAIFAENMLETAQSITQQNLKNAA